MDFTGIPGLEGRSRGWDSLMKGSKKIETLKPYTGLDTNISEFNEIALVDPEKLKKLAGTIQTESIESKMLKGYNDKGRLVTLKPYDIEQSGSKRDPTYFAVALDDEGNRYKFNLSRHEEGRKLKGIFQSLDLEAKTLRAKKRREKLEKKRLEEESYLDPKAKVKRYVSLDELLGKS